MATTKNFKLTQREANVLLLALEEAIFMQGAHDIHTREYNVRLFEELQKELKIQMNINQMEIQEDA